MRTARLLLTATLSGLFLIIGCAANGPRFSPIRSVPQGKALVYIYRPNELAFAAMRYQVATGSERIALIIRGGYYPYLADPGERAFWARTEIREEITEYLEAGKTYYLKAGVGPGVALGRPEFSFESADVGAKEVAKCVRLRKARSRKKKPDG